jgi:hypothetical protein
LEWLAALVAGFDPVPVFHPFFGGMPAEKDHLSIPFVREVEEAHVEVFNHYSQLLDPVYGPIQPVRFHAVLGAFAPTTVRWRCSLNRLDVRRFLAERVAVPENVLQDLLEFRQQSVCFFHGEELGEGMFHGSIF